MSSDYTLRKNYPLTKEQNEIIDFMISKPYCICAAQTGFGKTYLSMTLACHLLLKYKDTHAIVLCPQKAVKAFKKELTEKLRVSFNLFTSNKSTVMNGARITVITHTSLKKHIDYITNLREEGHRLIMICDECHILESKDNKFRNLVASIRHYFTLFYGLTATPLKNNIEGLYWLMNMLNPSILKSWEWFKSSFLVIDRHPITRLVGRGKNKYKKVVWEEEIVGYKNIPVLRNILDKYIIIKQKAYNLEFSYHKAEIQESEKQPYLEARSRFT